MSVQQDNLQIRLDNGAQKGWCIVQQANNEQPGVFSVGEILIYPPPPRVA